MSYLTMAIIAYMLIGISLTAAVVGYSNATWTYASFRPLRLAIGAVAWPIMLIAATIGVVIES